MNKKELKKLLIIFLLSRIFLILFLIIKKDLSILTLYDGKHYVKMAEYGYNEPLLYAFFPLYPLLIRLIHIIIPSYVISGLLLSNICSFLSLIILDKMTKDKFNNLPNLIYLVFSPILAYTSIVYTESLFMFLTLLGFYLYRKDKYLLSAIVVGLSMLTRNSGIILWGAIGLDMLFRLFKKKDISFKNIFIYGIVSLSIGMLYPIYLYITNGDFLLFAKVQETYWFREKGTIITGIIRDIKVLKRDIYNGNLLIFIENWASFFITFILGIKIFKKDKASSIYIIVSLLAFSSMYRNINYWTSLASISLFRYVFNLFPIYLYTFDNKSNNQKLIIAAIIFFITAYNTVALYIGNFIG